MTNGSGSNGLKLELKPEKNSYNAGEMPVFIAEIFNISDKDILFCAYLVKHRLLCSLKGDGHQVIPFGFSHRPLIKNGDIVVLKPGEKITFPISPADDPAYGFVNETSLPPLVDKSFVLKGFPRGEYDFKIYLGDYVSFYSSPDGTYDFGKDRKHILREVPKDKEMALDLTRAWQGELSAQCHLKFL